MDIGLIILIILTALFLLNIWMFTRFAQRKTRELLQPVRESGLLQEGGKAAEAYSRLNVTSKEQLDRYLAFTYRDMMEGMRKLRPILVVAVLLVCDVVAGFVVVKAVGGGPVTSYWIKTLFVPLVSYVGGVLAFLLAMMLISFFILRKMRVVYEEYLDIRGD